jgi:hypothetical protein
MALIREVKSEPKRNRRHIVVRTVLISFGLEIAQLSIRIYRYRENHDAKNVITGGARMREGLNGDLISTV